MRMKLLISYHYFKKTNLDDLFQSMPKLPEVFADSGAFSAYSQRVPVDVHEFAAWCKKWHRYFVVYSNLDVIKNAEGTWRNQRILEDQYGLSPIPVFHAGEDWSYLDRYVNAGHTYIALGGMVGTDDRGILAWIVKAYRRARAINPDVQFHGFGQTKHRILRSVPWYSVDSSSWGSGYRYGTVKLWDDRKGKFIQFRLRDSQACYRHGSLIREHGYDPASFATEAAYHRGTLAGLSAVSWVRYEGWLRRRHGVVKAPDAHLDAAGVPVYKTGGPDDAAVGDGLKLWLAVQTSDAQWAGGALDGPRVYLADGSTHKLRAGAGAIHEAEARGTLDGPRVYLADGGIPNLRDASAAIDKIKPETRTP